jgi:hypothetical protein
MASAGRLEVTIAAASANNVNVITVNRGRTTETIENLMGAPCFAVEVVTAYR